MALECFLKHFMQCTTHRQLPHFSTRTLALKLAVSMSELDHLQAHIQANFFFCMIGIDFFSESV